MNFNRATLHVSAAVLFAFALASTVFSQTDKKLAHGILIDNSNSLRTQFPTIIKLSKGIVERVYQGGPISLFPFNSPPGKSGALIPIIGIEWSQDKSLLDKYIESIFIVPGQTTLHDKINVIASHLNTKVSSEKDAYEGKMIFLITDGEERASKLSERDLIKKLKENGIRVYAIGLVQELDTVGGLVRAPPKEKQLLF